MRGPSEEEMRAFIARHWLDTQQNTAAVDSWFSALNTSGWRFPGLSQALGGPCWDERLRLKWVQLNHRHRTPADPTPFCNLLIPLLNRSSTGAQLEGNLQAMAALDWRVACGMC